MVPRTFVFHRPTLAASIVAGLAGESLLDYSSGLFLASPRHTGKSTFLRQDMMPACEQRGWEVIYVDLWSSPHSDPGVLIERAIMAKLQSYASRIKQPLSTGGSHVVRLYRTLPWDQSQPTLPDGVTLVEALQALHEVSGYPVVLFIDEAQHALNSERGMNAMFALKAARDALTLGVKQPGLRLVFTGSSRDKLAKLVMSRDQPFFGNTVIPFPLLGSDFIEAFTQHINAKLAPGNTFQVTDVAQTFEHMGHRPELLWEIVKRIALELGQAPELGRLLKQGANAVQADSLSIFQAEYDPLTELQQAILFVLSQAAAENRPFTPFTQATLQEIQARAGRKTQPAPSSIQRGLDSLREKGLVWRSGRGVYALEDSGMGEWLLSDDSEVGVDDPMQYSYVGNTLDRLDRDFLQQPHIVRPITADTLSEALRLTNNMEVDLEQPLRGEDT
ncbi:MAG: hypothetical protein ACTIJ3_10945 [Halomonadaceae bacterium]|uniref:hypothetical protein n=1 Tax=Halomonas sp. AOP42-B2-16 TaxID=3457673 RepID=UPI003FD90EDE